MQRRIHDFLPEVKDFYTINSLGEIFSDNSGKMKTRNKSNTDYQIINFMTVDGNKKTFRVHRLVALAFLPQENGKTEVNHKDGNKKNNSVDNLEWCTPSENQLHAFSIGLQKARKGEMSNFSKLTKKDIKKIFYLKSLGYLQKDIAKEVGCTKSNISCILKHKSWKD